MPRKAQMPKPLPVIVGSQAVSVFAMRDGWVRWKITAPGPMPERGIVLWLDPFDIVSLGKRSVAAIKAAQR